MIADPISESARALTLSAREQYLRTAMLADPEFMAGIERGRQQIERGEFITLDEMKRELGFS